MPRSDDEARRLLFWASLAEAKAAKFGRRDFQRSAERKLLEKRLRKGGAKNYSIRLILGIDVPHTACDTAPAKHHKGVFTCHHQKRVPNPKRHLKYRSQRVLALDRRACCLHR